MWHGYLQAHPSHKFMRYESDEQFDDLKIIFNGTTANGNNSLGLGVTTDACTYEVDDNQSGDDVTDTSPTMNKPEELESGNNDYVVTVSNKILDIIQQREERQQREAEKTKAEKKKNSVWDAVKEITHLDQRSKFKAVTLIYSLGTKDVFADMHVEERIGWIQTNIGSD
ncbi:unnamed protein product [Arabis nemorensis]|uniref:At2g29880-like C-terminal domain-containing protein n=1 Tax=Arabis nemorensis TaxID=586526 RepID=A0A565AX76_9BRAS|nr:unnamed protein product [Arabis nemorensis]